MCYCGYRKNSNFLHNQNTNDNAKKKDRVFVVNDLRTMK